MLWCRFEVRVVVLEVPIPVLKGQQVTIHAHTGTWVGGWVDEGGLGHGCLLQQVQHVVAHFYPAPLPIACHAMHLLAAARESGHISGLVSLLNAKTGEVQRVRPRCLLKGQTAVVEVAPARPMCLEEYAAYRALGRVALRDCGRTIAVGIVSSIPDS
jgi:elongation factor 1 alpha-like protein